MTRGQRGSLLLRCGAPSSPTLRRFIPALSDRPLITVQLEAPEKKSAARQPFTAPVYRVPAGRRGRRGGPGGRPGSVRWFGWRRGRGRAGSARAAPGPGERAWRRYDASRGGNLHSDPPAVMDDQPFSGPAHAAAMVVAGQYFLAQAAEAGAGAAAAPVAGQAPPPAKQLEAAAGAAERDLRVEGHGVSH